jgi:hypothetical protein
LIAYLLLLSFLSAGLVAFPSPTAHASPPISCIYGFGFNEQATNGTHTDNHRGIKANQWTYAWDSNDCQRIVGVSVKGAPGGFVEFSYVLGWSNCSGNYHPRARSFIWWRPAGGTDHCEMEGLLTEGEWHTFSVKDADENTTWKAYRNTVFVDDMNVNFDRGNVVALRERGNTDDEGRAHWKNLQFLLANWNDWADPDEDYDTDEGYGQVYVSANEVKVVPV